MSIRRVEITVPHDQFDNVLTLLTHSCKIPRWTGTGGVDDHVVALSGPTHHVFQIMCAGHKVGGVIRQLETIGCGEDYGQISVTTLDAARPGLDAPHLFVRFLSRRGSCTRVVRIISPCTTGRRRSGP